MSGTTTASTTPTSAASLGTSLRQRVEKVASWEDVAHSAAYTAGLNVACFLAAFVSFNPLVAGLMVAGSVFLVGYPLSLAFHWTEGDAQRNLVTEAQAQKLAGLIQNGLNYLYAAAAHVFYWTDTRLSLIVTGGCFAAALLMRVFSLFVVCILAMNVYLLKKPATRLYFQHCQQHVQPYLDQAKSRYQNVPSIQQIYEMLMVSTGKTKKL